MSADRGVQGWPKKMGLGLLGALLFLAGLEGILRLAGEPAPRPLVIVMPSGEEEPFEVGEEGMRPLYQGPVPIGWVPLQPQGRRILVYGGSSVRNHVGPNFKEFADLIAEQLQVDVANLGAPGLDSGHLVPIVEGSQQLQPDTVIVYSGHNDLGNAVFMNRYGDMRSVMIWKTRRLVGGLAIFQHLQAMLATSRFEVPSSATQGSWTVTPEQRLHIRKRYGAHLRRIVRSASGSGARVLLATVASNAHVPASEWTCPEELGSLGLEGDIFAPIFQRVDREEAARRAADTDCPDLLWLHGVVNGDAEALDRARDLDHLPLRADRETVQLIRKIAEEEGATLVDVDAQLRHRGGGIAPGSLFVDQVHYSQAGHRELARLFIDALQDRQP